MSFNWSLAIDRLTKDIEAGGWSVDLFAFDLGDRIAGRCYYDRQHIDCNMPTARLAYLTLAHEDGHRKAFVWHDGQSDDEFSSRFPVTETREAQAYAFGWSSARRYAPHLTKLGWRKFHDFQFGSVAKWVSTKRQKPASTDNRLSTIPFSV